MKRPWAVWRRMQYSFGFLMFFAAVFLVVYITVIHEPPTCFDSSQNGEERGVDCGGACVRICSFDVLEPASIWARAFRVTDGQYNAVAYIENKNLNVGTPELSYTFSLYDSDGLITERSGTTVLPPDSVYPIFEGRIMTGSREPTLTRIELDEAEVWLPAEAGREQFVVNDRQLEGAGSLPRLNAQLTNTALTEAQDVEIVATIFDAQGNALTASRTVVPYFSGRTTETVVFTWPEPIAKTVRSCEVPTDVILAIDLSGSMNDDGGDPPEPISSVLDAAEAFTERLQENDQVGVVTYATDVTIAETLTGNVARAADVIADLSIAPKEETGNTNTGDAIRLSGDEINSARHNIDARRVLVLLTDGLANAPGDEPEQYAINSATTLKESGVTVFAIGLGDNVNEEFLRSIASSNDHYFKAASAETVGRIYRLITSAICEDGPAVIEIIPKTGASFAPLR